MLGKEIVTIQFYFQPVPQNDMREVEGLDGTQRVQSYSSFTIAVVEVHVDLNHIHRATVMSVMGVLRQLGIRRSRRACGR
jgi:hypothetical protein